MFLKKINMNICDTYIILWCLYYLQGTLYPVGGVISNSLLIVSLLISIYYFFYCNLKYRIPLYLKSLNLLIVLFSIYGVIMMIDCGALVTSPYGQTIPSKNYLQTIYTSLLSVYPFYVFSYKRLLTYERLKKWIIVFIVVVTLSFFREERERIARLISDGIVTDGVTNNSGYLFLSLIPGLMFFKSKPILQYFALAYCTYFIIIGMKRGAILIGIICIIFFIYSNIKQANSKQKWSIILFVLLFLFWGYAFIERFAENSSYFQSRIEDTESGNTSGRDFYYSTLWNYFLMETNNLKLLFGNGAEGAFHAVGYVAHNDWLEILLGQGILGFMIYVYYWFSFIIEWKKSNDVLTKSVIGLTLLVFFMKTMFSMSYQTMSFYTNSVLAYCLYINNKKCNYERK